MNNYNRISRKIREEIMICRANGDSQGTIARQTGFSQSAISRELKKDEDRGAYNPFMAQRMTDSYARGRARALKINDSTWQVIEKNHLAIRWSLYQIADFLHKSVNDATVVPVSENTIYNYLHFHMKGELKKLALQELRQKGKKRSTKGTEKRGKLAHITLIDERAEEVNARRC